MSLHLGILQTDHVLEQFQDEHGDYPHMFHQLFSEVDPSVTYTDYDVQCALPREIVCDAYVITGSKCSVYDDLPWIPPLVEFLSQVLQAQKKILGICFGHQLMAHFFGGRVAAADAGWRVGVHDSQVLQSRSWMQGEQQSIGMLYSHKDQVLELPEGAEVFLGNDSCPVGGYTIGSEVITVQGHPEFAKGYSRDLMNVRKELLGDSVHQRGIASLTKPTDSVRIARWMLEFARG